MAVKVIVTAPPYADYLEEIVAHPLVCGLRLNTVMPIKDGPGEALDRLSGFGVPLWVDLKGRQLRVVSAAIPPFTEVQISHPIRVQTPTDIFFSDGREHGRLVAVNGDRLILENGPRRVIGPWESVNIPHSSLEIKGTLTQTDCAYLEAMKDRGLKHVMLSFVERPEDTQEVLGLLPDADVIAKIESRRGLGYARKHGNRFGRLAAARGDLFVELARPHHLPGATAEIIEADPDAVAASRIFDSLAFHPVPLSSEIADVALLFMQGFRTLLLGDSVSLRRDSLVEALNLIERMDERYLH